MASIYGIHAVKAALIALDSALANEYESSILSVDRLKKSNRLQQLISLAKKKKVKLQFAQKKELDKLCNSQVHQGVVFSHCSQTIEINTLKNEIFLEDLIEKSTHPLFLLILDGVQDPHNLGACLRTANAAGVDAVIIPRDRSVGLTPVVRKVACGAEQTTPLIQVTNLSRTIDYLKTCHTWIIGAAGETQKSLYDSQFSASLGIDNLAIVMGAEEKGMRRLTKDKCDSLVKIPMYGDVESFNVSVATGIILYEVVRQKLLSA